METGTNLWTKYECGNYSFRFLFACADSTCSSGCQEDTKLFGCFENSLSSYTINCVEDVPVDVGAPAVWEREYANAGCQGAPFAVRYELLGCIDIANAAVDFRKSATNDTYIVDSCSGITCTNCDVYAPQYRPLDVCDNYSILTTSRPDIVFPTAPPPTVPPNPNTETGNVLPKEP